MKIFKNFTDKSELNIFEKNLKENLGVIFKVSETGDDWYELTKKLELNDTYKLLTTKDDKTGLEVIRCFSKSSTTLSPLNKTFNLVEFDLIPEGLDLSGLWVVDTENEKIYKRDLNPDEILDRNKEKQKELLNKAYSEITPLTYAEELTLASKDELEKLKNLKLYVLNLTRLDLSQNDVSWPTEVE